MTVTVPKATYSGCAFYELSIVKDVKVKVELGKVSVKRLRRFLNEHPDAEEVRLGFTMNFTVDLTSNSWKYGDELQFKAWTKDAEPEIDFRARQNGYDRVEILTEVTEGLGVMFDALKKFQESKANTEKPTKPRDRLIDFV